MTDYGLRTLHWRSIPQVGAGKGGSYTEGLGIGVKGWMGWIENNGTEVMYSTRNMCRD